MGLGGQRPPSYYPFGRRQRCHELDLCASADCRGALQRMGLALGSKAAPPSMAAIRDKAHAEYHYFEARSSALLALQLCLNPG